MDGTGWSAWYPLDTERISVVLEGDCFFVYSVFQMKTITAHCKRNTRQTPVLTPVHMQKGSRWIASFPRDALPLFVC